MFRTLHFELFMQRPRYCTLEKINPTRKRSCSKTHLKKFENTVTSRLSRDFLLQTQIQKWLVIVEFLNSSSVVWMENIWCVFRVKPPFSNSSSVAWQDLLCSFSLECWNKLLVTQCMELRFSWWKSSLVALLYTNTAKKKTFNLVWNTWFFCHKLTMKIKISTWRQVQKIVKMLFIVANRLKYTYIN